MVCEVKVNSIKYLEKEKATDDVRRIIDTAKFNELNESLKRRKFRPPGLPKLGRFLWDPAA